MSKAGHTLDDVKPHSEPVLSPTTIGGGRGLICVLVVNDRLSKHSCGVSMIILGLLIEPEPPSPPDHLRLVQQ